MLVHHHFKSHFFIFYQIKDKKFKYAYYMNKGRISSFIIRRNIKTNLHEIFYFKSFEKIALKIHKWKLLIVRIIVKKSVGLVLFSKVNYKIKYLLSIYIIYLITLRRD